MGEIFRGEWDCNKCGRENISIVNNRCPSCGAVRDANVTYHEPRSGEREFVTGQEAENARTGQDWKCSYCDRLNHAWNEKCECGASKSESDANYFELKAKEKEKQQEIREREQADEVARQQAELDNNPLESEQNVRKKSIYMGYSRNNGDSGGSKAQQNWSRLGFIALAVIIIFSLIGLLIPKKTSIDVTSVSWKYTVNIEEEREFYENDWNLPSGARLDHTEQQVRSYKSVPDGNEIVTKYRYVTVPDGTEEVIKDLGNGYFERSTVNKTKTIQESYTVEEVKYKQVPVMDTMYYYYIDRYVYNRSIVTEGVDKKPYFGELNLSSKERENTRDKAYYITGIDKKGNNVTYTISESDWKALDKGLKVEGKVYMGHFTLNKESGVYNE